MDKFNSIGNQYKAIVIGGSAGSFQVINKILSSIPRDFELPIIMCLHRLRHVRNGFVEALNIKSNIEIKEPLDKESIKKNTIYLAPANYHLGIDIGNTFALSTDDLVNNSRPSIDILLQTASYVYKHKLVGILLSGANRDGASGMQKIAERGGLTVIQDPKDCLIDTMPASALKLTTIDYSLNTDSIIEFLLALDKSIKSVALLKNE